mgnify:CR=1 FL=1
MTDIFSVEKRSSVMSRIRSTGTAPERLLFSALQRAVGPELVILRNVDSLPGKPDAVLPDLKVAVFADGCFFHSCPEHGRVPRSNTAYWKPKLQRTARRDRRNGRALRADGYSVWRFWEHDLRPSSSDRVERVIRGRVERRKRQLGMS